MPWPLNAARTSKRCSQCGPTAMRAAFCVPPGKPSSAFRYRLQMYSAWRGQWRRYLTPAPNGRAQPQESHCPAMLARARGENGPACRAPAGIGQRVGTAGTGGARVRPWPVCHLVAGAGGSGQSRNNPGHHCLPCQRPARQSPGGKHRAAPLSIIVVWAFSAYRCTGMRISYGW